MRKTQYVYFFFLFACAILAIIIACSSRIMLAKDEIPANTVIYKEVIVYVEKKPEPKVIPIVEEPATVYYKQPLDYNFDIMIPSGYTREQLYQSLGGVRDGVESSIDAVVTAEETYGVNALYLLSMIGFESGWGTVESGTNNIAGWKGNADNTWSDYNSRHDCIMDVANGLANDFVLDVGPTIYNITGRYTPDEGYVDTLLQIMSELENNIY